MKDKSWYAKYLRAQIRRIFQWSPSRKAAKRRAQVAKNPEAYQCETCGAEPLYKGQYEIDHTIPCVNVMGFDSWSDEIERTLAVTVEGLTIMCKPCHYKKSAEENKARRAYAKKGPDTEDN
jgi:5-methylcytosine-specific restriction endonuclease McrA